MNEKLNQLLRSKKYTISQLVRYTKTQTDFNNIYFYFITERDSLPENSIGFELYTENIQLYFQLLKGYKETFILNYGF